MKLSMLDLETERLQLRAFRLADRSGVAAWEQTVDANAFLEFCFRSYREWGMGPWAMVLKQSGVIVGNSAFCRISYDRTLDTFEYCGEVNYYVAPRYRGAGLATEAVSTMLKFGFGDLKLTRIQARCPPENVGSERVMQKAGSKFERMIPGTTAATTGCSSEEKLYALTREAFHASSST